MEAALADGERVSRPEPEMVARARAGDREACRALYDACAGRVAAYFLRSGFARADADDLAQQTFLRAFRSLGTFDPDRGTFRGWLAAIARNVARKEFSRRARPDRFDPELAEDLFAAEDNPGAAAAEREEIDAVRQCVAALPDELGRLVRLRYVQGLTTRGVAEAADMPESTVRLRLGEARRRLRECLAGKGVLE